MKSKSAIMSETCLSKTLHYNTLLPAASGSFTVLTNEISLTAQSPIMVVSKYSILCNIKYSWL